jgi:hypothetical protein
MSLQKGCVLHAPLDQESYNPATLRFTDKSAVGNHGTSANAANFTADRMGQVNRAAVFNGTTDYVRISDDNSLYTPSTLSVFCWVKGASQNTRTIVTQWDNVLSQRAFRLLTGGTTQMRTIVTDNGGWTAGHRKDYQSNVNAFDNNWHNIGFTFNAGVLKLYKDGVEDTTPTKLHDDTITTIHDSTADASIGASFSNSVPASYFTGSIDDVRIYNRILTESERTYLYESYRPKLMIGS